MKAAAQHLGNTPAVARSAYVDPRVVDRFVEGEPLLDPEVDHLVDAEVDDLDEQDYSSPDWHRWEAAVLALLDDQAARSA
jgi:DNA topoisomerase IB